MSDQIEYEESDDEYVELESNTVPLGEGLYESECVECERGLMWTIVADPDNPRWNAECCGHRYTMSVSDVELRVTDAEI